MREINKYGKRETNVKTNAANMLEKKGTVLLADMFMRKNGQCNKKLSDIINAHQTWNEQLAYQLANTLNLDEFLLINRLMESNKVTYVELLRVVKGCLCAVLALEELEREHKASKQH